MSFLGQTAASGGHSARRRLKVGVLVDLALSDTAGGHVKCWQRLAEAAVEYREQLDLTVHFSGFEPRRIELSDSVRYIIMPPVFSTARVIRELPDHTDLARWHPRLAAALTGYDVIHTTDAFFCYASTATRVGRRHGIPVVSSTHTNTPEYARITTEKLLQRLLGHGRAFRAANDNLALPLFVKGLLEARLRRHLEQVVAAMGSSGAALDPKHPDRHRGLLLRRGIDRALFSPKRRDREWLERRFGVPSNHLVLMYAGKLDAGKNVPLLAPIMLNLREAGHRVHLLLAGAGAEQRALEDALGASLTCAGPLDQTEVARAYASADLFLFPSAIDELGNAAIEAMACGLPTLVAAGSGVAMRMADCAGMLVLPGDNPQQWAAIIAQLIADPKRRAAMGAASRSFAETRIPSWAEVLEQDLLPIWQAVAIRV